MSRDVHFRIPGESATASNPTACTIIGFNTYDTDLVTCGACQLTGIYILTHQRHSEVVEALAYPKEDHKCLAQHRPSISATNTKN